MCGVVLCGVGVFCPCAGQPSHSAAAPPLLRRITPLCAAGGGGRWRVGGAQLFFFTEGCFSHSRTIARDEGCFLGGGLGCRRSHGVVWCGVVWCGVPFVAVGLFLKRCHIYTYTHIVRTTNSNNNKQQQNAASIGNLSPSCGGALPFERGCP